MAINRILFPDNLSTQADFSKHAELIETSYFDAVTSPLQFVGGVIPQGMVFNIGGVIYRADSDTSITGTASDYVRIVPDGATATANYESTLTGVAWAKQYNGYYDSSTPAALYLFDEGKALAAGQINAVFGRYLMQQANGDVQVGRDLIVERDLGVGMSNPIAPLEVRSGGDDGTIRVGRTAGKPSIKSSNDGSGHMMISSKDAYLGLNHYEPDNVVMVNGGGNVGIGKTTPTTKLDVDGGIASSTVNTGQGNNNLYAMNQNVRTTDNVAFNNIKVSGGGASTSRADEFSAGNYYRGVRFASGTTYATIREYFRQYITTNSIGIGTAGVFGIDPVSRIFRTPSGDISFFNNSDTLIFTATTATTTTSSAIVVLFPVLG